MHDGIHSLQRTIHLPQIPHICAFEVDWRPAILRRTLINATHLIAPRRKMRGYHPTNPSGAARNSNTHHKFILTQKSYIQFQYILKPSAGSISIVVYHISR
jgi:hypothetical protein